MDRIELDNTSPRRSVVNDVSRDNSRVLDYSDGIHTMQERNRLRKWWLTNIRPEVAAEDGDPRDFLALERTFLAYVRTANALASFAIVAAQLFILHHDSVVAGKVLACLSLAFAIYIQLMGAVRYFKQQRLLQRRKCYVWNPESIRVALLFFVVSTVALVLVVVFG
ncbi:hypothetical protein BDV32DRAFT_87038 [Aspergillus pseudonomiae]|uniref:Uncharacterized protein n=1 Tax=Aspergillus pseudonomiae TaxID=1506151 RepID=A0A5N7DFX6_9EURO|nr:uncharacterized protein BDV37DRAFT_246996 [Aspergillus pseudonomiae]KAB8257105.1 hypothetical protein BDV32DRAFT_87038 [Aspergillus pseudonomiae]KAE8404558.1 hypothetical protein BDV37DRAFT_246996 [Aspergillus pseudonomiae]